MAETTANEAAQRYAVIEQAYAKEDWEKVVGEGESLLLQLRDTDNPQLNGLAMRLQLLLGHTKLYGHGDKAAAGRFYAAVAEQSEEAALTRIAEQGLKQCIVEAPPAAEPSPEAAPAEEAPAAGLETSGPAPANVMEAAAPWLTAAAAASAPAAEAAAAAAAPAAPWDQPSLIPDVVEEPELIELHLADPDRAEEVELSWKEPERELTPAEKDEEELRAGLMLVRIR